MLCTCTFVMKLQRTFSSQVRSCTGLTILMYIGLG